MKPAFTLAAYPRRTHPLLSEPPAAYFGQLPTRVMARQTATSYQPTRAAWWRRLPGALRTSLVSSVLLSGFAAAFWLSSGPELPPTATTALDAVPTPELVNYLLQPGADLETTDLVPLTAARPGMATSFLVASPAELSEALENQADDTLHL